MIVWPRPIHHGLSFIRKRRADLFEAARQRKFEKSCCSGFGTEEDFDAPGKIRFVGARPDAMMVRE